MKGALVCDLSANVTISALAFSIFAEVASCVNQRVCEINRNHQT